MPVERSAHWCFSIVDEDADAMQPTEKTGVTVFLKKKKMHSLYWSFGELVQPLKWDHKSASSAALLFFKKLVIRFRTLELQNAIKMYEEHLDATPVVEDFKEFAASEKWIQTVCPIPTLRNYDNLSEKVLCEDVSV